MLYVDLEGVGVSAVTLEHIVPQAWFERSKVIAALNLPFVDRNDTKNLALACPRCNHDKGKGHDTRANDPRARAVVLALLEKRLARYLDA
jgi:5-methylcytosine-specific restriction endonuclease McrA